MPTSITQTLRTNIADARELFAAAEQLAPELERAGALLRDALLAGRKLLCCGNGGSAADSAHFTTEIAGRYKLERPGYPAIDLTAEHALITALINDYPASEVFARLVQAHGKTGDVLVVLSTSGNSENVRLALLAARERGLHTIAFLGKGGGQCKDLADVPLIAPHDVTVRIQELHLLLYHTLCEWLDPQLASPPPQ